MSHQGFDSTFKEFKNQFYNRVGDGSCFNVLNFNILKVVLDGLKVQYTKRGKINHQFGNSVLVTYFLFLIKVILDTKKRTLFKTNLNKIPDNLTLIGFTDRAIKDENKTHSIYFQKIFNQFGRDKFCYVSNSSQNKLNANFLFSDLPLGFNVFNKQNRIIFSELKKILNNEDFKNKWNKNEYENIQIATYLFFIDYIKWDYFLKNKKIKSSLLICHYHNEGFILACKRNGIMVNELQHGLIAKEDIFYVIPNQVKSIIKKALFADRILVYGNYWKTTLLQGCEYSENDIKEVGYYHFESITNTEHDLVSNKKIILITTQYSAEKHFIDFAEKLSPKLTSEWVIWIKPHPAEKIELYKFLEKKYANVNIVQGNLDSIINKSEFLVTIFSTTIFDAVRKGKMAFALNIPLYADYVEGVVKSGAAHILDINENPVDKLNQINAMIDSKMFYDDFNSMLIDQLINY